MKIILLWNIFSIVHGFLISPIIIKEKYILQECCKINKNYSNKLSTKLYYLITNIIKNNNNEKFYIENMFNNSKWRLIYSNIESYNYKIYEYIFNYHTKYIYIPKNNILNKNNDIIETKILQINNNYVHIKPFLINKKINYSSVISDYKLLYISEKIKIIQLNDSKLFKIYYRIF